MQAIQVKNEKSLRNMCLPEFESQNVVQRLRELCAAIV